MEGTRSPWCVLRSLGKHYLKKIRIFTGKVVESSEISLGFDCIIQTQIQEYVYI